VHLSDTWCQQFLRLCGHQVRQRGEILLDLDSTDDPTYGQQQLSFFNGAYGQHMYQPMLIFERHTGCLLAARSAVESISRSKIEEGSPANPPGTASMKGERVN
jgi:hypothetical protein